MANDKYSYLGTAQKFPTEITQTGSISLASGPDVVKQSITRALATGLGTVFFNRTMGSRLKHAQYEQNEDLLRSMLALFIEETIQKHEERVEYIDTEYDFRVDVVMCTINVRILQSNEIDALVWPYYRNS